MRNHQPMMEGSDHIYNSTDVAHDSRWVLLLPSRQDTLRYMEAVLSRAIGELDGVRDLSSDEFYFYLLATFHEGMHAEALTYTRQTLGYPAPRFTNAKPNVIDHNPQGAFPPDDDDTTGGTFG